MSQRSARSARSQRSTRATSGAHPPSAAFLAAGRKNFAGGRAKGHAISAAHTQAKRLARGAQLQGKKATRHPARARKT